VFETIQFKILIDRLTSLGVKGSTLKWFESHLIGRSIRVCFDDVISTKFFINCGVPQGSVLSPLLYLVCVDTMRYYVPGVVNTSFTIIPDYRVFTPWYFCSDSNFSIR